MHILAIDYRVCVAVSSGLPKNIIMIKSVVKRKNFQTV